MAIKIQNMRFQKLILVLGLMIINDWSPCSASLNLNSDDPETQHADHENIQSNIQFQRDRIDLVNDGAWLNYQLERQNQGLILSPQVNQFFFSHDSSRDNSRESPQLGRSLSQKLRNAQPSIQRLADDLIFLISISQKSAYIKRLMSYACKLIENLFS